MLMNTHADKKQEAPRQNVSEKIAQMEQEATAMGQLEDRRPEALVQKKVQGLVNKSPQASKTAQLKAMLTKNAKPALQMKPLNPGVLNVAGEQHDKADKFRMWEKEYAAAVTHGGYWQENEFKIQIDNPKQEEGGQVAVHGDPKILQMANIIHFSTLRLSNVTRLLKPLQSMKSTKFNVDTLGRPELFRKLNLVQDQLSLILEFRKVFRKLRAESQIEVVKRPELKDHFNLYSVYGDRLYDDFAINVDNWVKETSKLNKDSATHLEVNKAAGLGGSFYALGSELVNQLFEKTEINYDENKAVSDEVIMARSQEMHKAASHGKDSIGLWKIGEQHVTDIKGQSILGSGNPSYELMTADEFNSDFQQWLKQSHLYKAWLYGKGVAHIYDWGDETILELAKKGSFDEMLEARKNAGPRPSYIS